jgi:hypothetical protein
MIFAKELSRLVVYMTTGTTHILANWSGVAVIAVLVWSFCKWHSQPNHHRLDVRLDMSTATQVISVNGSTNSSISSIRAIKVCELNPMSP